MARTAVRAALYDAMEAEVESLCGPRYRPDPQLGLETYAAASSQVNFFEGVVEAVMAGASLRGVGRAKAGSLGKSSAARMWAEKGTGRLAELRSRDLSGRDLEARRVRRRPTRSRSRHRSPHPVAAHPSPHVPNVFQAVTSDEIIT